MASETGAQMINLRIITSIIAPSLSLKNTHPKSINRINGLQKTAGEGIVIRDMFNSAAVSFKYIVCSVTSVSLIYRYSWFIF